MTYSNSGSAWFVAACAGALLLVRPAAAQDEQGSLPPSFTSDQPGFANGTGVAAREHVTVELSASGSFAGASSGSLPNLSLRTGLFDWLEARVRGPNAVGRFGGGGAVFGVADPVVGFKAGGRLADSLTISMDWEVSLPLATEGFGSPEATFFADLNLDWGFFGPLTLTPNLVASILSETDPVTGESAREFEGGGSLKLTWQALDVLGLYVQGYVLKSETSDWRVQVGGGLFWMVARNVQVNASFDAAVTEQGDAPTAAIGATTLF